MQGCAQSACFRSRKVFLDTALYAPKKKKAQSLHSWTSAIWRDELDVGARACGKEPRVELI